MITPLNLFKFLLNIDTHSPWCDEYTTIYARWMRKKHPSLLKLGMRIRELRKDKGFSQENFAAEVGLDRTYMGSVERGERNIAALNLIKIAKTLKVEVGALFPAAKSLSVD